MEKKKKILITVIFSAICIGVMLAVILFANSRRNQADSDTDSETADVRTFGSLEEAAEWAQFPMKTTDRLNGILATEYSAIENMIKVTFGKAGYITKTLIMEEESSETEPGTEQEAAPDEIAEKDPDAREINGVSVRFTWDDTAVTKAEWTDNGFDYVIVLTEKSVTADMMTDYVSATR